MINDLKNLIVNKINGFTGLTTVDTDNPNKKPDYPFYSMKFTSIKRDKVMQGNLYEDFADSLDPRFTYDVLYTLERQPHAIISFNCYSDTLSETFDYIAKAWEYFAFYGYQTLKDNNFIVINVTDIQDRTLFDGVTYEYRQGFDVEIRFLHTMEERIENIETYKITRGEDF